jgi:5-(carboxyamino)imidazole ribonucleotide synthase
MATIADVPVVEPNGVVGMLGGGQLGRMLAMSAAQLGLKTIVYAPESECPAADCAAEVVVGGYEDEASLARFAALVDVVTYEFENVPARTVEILQSLDARVAPGAKALAVAQDRLVEKQFIQSIGARVAPYHAVDSIEDLAEGLAHIGAPAILKTRRLGYDGKGQSVIRDAARQNAGDLETAWRAAQEKAWSEIGANPSILEGFIEFVCEISVIGARGLSGETCMYDAAENVHSSGILKTSMAPASVSPATIAAANDITKRLLSALDYVGVLGVEFFVLKDGSLLVNEFAPRVHNSGHWTMDACAISQFEQHIRAVCGWPLGETTRHSDVVMENLIGAEANTWREIGEERSACLHLYGKREAKPGRKMGHVNRLSPLT